MKNKTQDIQYFECAECGYQTTKWAGKCTQCEAWNSFVAVTQEHQIQQDLPSAQDIKERLKSLSDIQTKDYQRFFTGIDEWDRVLGGGIVPGSVVLVGGVPGIGKSTLLLQTAVSLVSANQQVLYVSGEESARQIKMRAVRIGNADKVNLICESDLDIILKAAAEIKPLVIIIDSIQVLNSGRFSSSAGSVTQLRECTFELARFAKKNSITVFLVGHVTKEGSLAGPKVLEHIVDTVIYFEGEDKTDLRMLRVQKNRFGPTNELGIFQMTTKGLNQVNNASALFLSHRPENISGTVIVPVIEGSRTFFVEIQALTVRAGANFSRRTFHGVDPSRTNIILGVLEKRAGLKAWEIDVYVNVVGGMKVDEVAADLGIALSIVSSAKSRPVAKDILVIGEIGLSGEIRPVSNITGRLKEAHKLGFTKCILPKQNLASAKSVKGIQPIGVETIQQAIEAIG